MKGYCYIALIIGFFIFFQQNPLYAVIIIGIILVGYLYFKSKRSGSTGGLFGFMKGNPQQQQQNSNLDDVITLMMIQQLFNSPTTGSSDLPNLSKEENKKENHIEQTKREVLELLDNLMRSD